MEISKTEITGSEEISGCELEITVKDTGEVQKVSVTDKKTPTPKVPQTGGRTPLMAAGCSGHFMHIPVRVTIKNIRKSVSGQGMKNGSISFLLCPPAEAGWDMMRGYL